MDKYLFGNKLYKLRTEKNLTQKQLGALLGVTDKAVSKWETGEAMPRVKKLQLIADCFGVSTEELLSENSINDTEQSTGENLECYKIYYEKKLKKKKREYTQSFIVSLIAVLFFIVCEFIIFFSTVFSGKFVSVTGFVVGGIIPIFASTLFILFLYNSIKDESKKSKTEVFVSALIMAVLCVIYPFLTDMSIITFVSSFIMSAIFIAFAVCFKTEKHTEKYHNIILALSIVGAITAIALVFLQIDMAYIAISLLIVVMAFLNIIDYIRLQKYLCIPHEESSNINNKKSKGVLRAAAILVSTICVLTVLFSYFAPASIIKAYLKTLPYSDVVYEAYDKYDVKFTTEKTNQITYGDMTCSLPDSYSVKSRSNYKGGPVTYSSGEITPVMLNMCDMTEEYTEDTIFDIDLTNEKSVKGHKLLLKMCDRYIGGYPRNEYDYYKLCYTITPDDIGITDYAQAIVYSMFLIPKSVAVSGNYGYIYESKYVHGFITMHEIPDGRTFVNSELYSYDQPNITYSISYFDYDNNPDTLYKILDSVKIK